MSTDGTVPGAVQYRNIGKTITIGAASAGSVGFNTNGRIDDVVITPYCMTQSEIFAIAKSGAPVVP
jgi:hypothetical protein